jgi:hypothetical protein
MITQQMKESRYEITSMKREISHKNGTPTVVVKALALGDRGRKRGESLRVVQTWCRKFKEVENINYQSAAVRSNFSKRQLIKNLKWTNLKSNIVGSDGPNNLFQVGKAGEYTKKAF